MVMYFLLNIMALCVSMSFCRLKHSVIKTHAIQRGIIILHVWHKDDCWTPGTVYTGELSYNVHAMPCRRWEIYASSLGYDLLWFPDESWDELSNKCRYLIVFSCC